MEDLTHMETKDLYDFGVERFKDVKLILQYAQKREELERQQSMSHESGEPESGEPESKLMIFSSI